MKIVIAAGTGFLGGVIRKYLPEHDYVILTRNPAKNEGNTRYVQWDARTIGDWKNELEGADVLINLTGKSVNCRYNEKNKAAIINSRVDATNTLGQALESIDNKPGLWINASSATIYKGTYGDPNNEIEHELGDGFSVNVCKEWEKVFDQFEFEGVRKATLRITIVLGKGSALDVLKKLTRIGFGGKQGSGKQYFSWIHEEDFGRLIKEIIENENCKGIINAANPNPITNAEFMRALRKSVGIKWGLPQTTWMVKLGAFFMGTEAELVLKSRRVVSKRLKELRFEFKYNQIAEALNSFRQ